MRPTLLSGAAQVSLIWPPEILRSVFTVCTRLRKLSSFLLIGRDATAWLLSDLCLCALWSLGHGTAAGRSCQMCGRVRSKDLAVVLTLCSLGDRADLQLGVYCL